MNTDLKKMENTQSNLTFVKDQLSEYLETQGDHLLPLIAEKIREEPKLSNLWGLKPNKIQKENTAMMVEHMKNIFKEKTNVFKYYSQTQLELVKIAGQYAIQSAGIQVMAQITVEIEEKTKIVTKTIEDGNIEFMASRSRQLDDMEQYRTKHPNDTFGIENYQEILDNMMTKRKESIQAVLSQFLDSMQKKQ